MPRNLADSQIGTPRCISPVAEVWRKRLRLPQEGRAFQTHNLHENRPGSFVSSDLAFATYQNAGVRVFDVSDAFRPFEVAASVPPAPTKMIDTRPKRAHVIQSCDIFVDTSGLIFTNDYNAGLFILERNG